MAVRVAVPVLVTVPAFAVNVAEPEPAPIEMLLGTLSKGLLLAIDSVTFVAAAFAKNIVQVEELPDDRLFGAQLSADKRVTGLDGGESVRLNVLLSPAPAAVNNTLVVLETAAAVALKLVDELPDGIVTLAGTDKFELLLCSVAVRPPLGAFPVALTEHVIDPGVVMVEVAHESALNVTEFVRLIVPPLPTAAIPLPSPAAATTPASASEMDE